MISRFWRESHVKFGGGESYGNSRFPGPFKTWIFKLFRWTSQETWISWLCKPRGFQREILFETMMLVCPTNLNTTSRATHRFLSGWSYPTSRQVQHGLGLATYRKARHFACVCKKAMLFHVFKALESITSRLNRCAKDAFGVFERSSLTTNLMISSLLVQSHTGSLHVCSEKAVFYMLLSVLRLAEVPFLLRLGTLGRCLFMIGRCC